MSQLGKFSFKDAARIVLKDTGVAMTPKEILAEALKRGLIKQGTGKTPDATLATHIYKDMRKKGENSTFIKPVEGVQKFAFNDPAKSGYKEQGNVSFTEAARIVLKDTGAVMTPKEIFREALTKGLIERGTGKTPEATMGSRIYIDIKKNREKSAFIQPTDGVQKFAFKDTYNSRSVTKAPAPSSDHQQLEEYLKAAQKILKNTGAEMTPKEIYYEALIKGLIGLGTGKAHENTEDTIASAIDKDISKKGIKSFFMQPVEGVQSFIFIDPTKKKGILYVAKNEAMPNYVKVGVSSDKESLVRRIKALFDTNVPLPFSLELAIETNEEATKIEKLIKKMFSEERAPKREFYPKNIMSSNEMEDLRELLSNSGGRELDVNLYNKKILSAAPNKKKKKKSPPKLRKATKKSPPSDLYKLGLKKGDTLIYKDDSRVTCEVHGNEHVVYRGEVMKLSPATREVRKERGDKNYPVNGFSFWEYEGELLTKRRIRLKGA